MPDHDGIHGFWFKTFNSIHNRLVLEQVPTKSTRTRTDDKRKDHIDPKGPKQRNPQQLQTHNLPTDDMENIKQGKRFTTR